MYGDQGRGILGDETSAAGTGIPTYARELGSDLTAQQLLLFLFGDGESSLKNVIYESNRQRPEQVAVPKMSTY